MWDLGRAAQNMVLAAWSLRHRLVPGHGLRAGPVPARSWAIPADHHCEYILSFGYPADPGGPDPSAEGGRPAQLDEVVHEERW